jgi:hypothetical protein
VAFHAAYNDRLNEPELPNRLSQLVNTLLRERFTRLVRIRLDLVYRYADKLLFKSADLLLWKISNIAVSSFYLFLCAFHIKTASPARITKLV